MGKQITEAQLKKLQAGGAKVKKTRTLEEIEGKLNNVDATRHSEMVSATKESSNSIAELAASVRDQAVISAEAARETQALNLSLMKDMVVNLQNQAGEPVPYRIVPHRGKRNLIEYIDVIPILPGDLQ